MHLTRRSLSLALVVGLSMGLASACEPEDLSAIPLGYNIDFTTQVQTIFNDRCDGCHIGGASGGLSLAPGNAHGNLVSVPSNNPSAGIPRVTPGNVDSSFLFRKLNCTALGSNFGSRMPLSGPPYLTVQQQAVIMDWIREGAFPLADADRVYGSGFEGRSNAGPFPN